MAEHDSPAPGWQGPRDTPGWRRVFQDAAGRYYREPDSGPRHHDDLQVTPDTVAKAMLDPNLDAEVKALLQASMSPPVAMLLGVTSPEPGIGSLITRVYLPDDLRRAHEHARTLEGYVVGLAVLADYSPKDPPQ